MRWFVVAVLLSVGVLCLGSGWEAVKERELRLEDVGWSPLAAYSLSPDGRWFVRVDPERGVYLWDTESGAFHGVFEPAGEEYWIVNEHLAWSPTGTYLAFWSFYVKEVRGELWLLDPARGQLRLLSAECPALLPTWSPNGENLAVVCGNKYGGRIVVTTLGDQEEDVVATYEGEIQWIRWVKGGRILYAVITGDGSPRYQIWEARDSGDAPPRLLWEREAFEADLGAVSPDGRYLWYAPFPELLDLRTGKVIPLTRPGEGGYPRSLVKSLVWAPEGDRFLYTYLYQDPQGKTYFPLLMGELDRGGEITIQNLVEPSPGSRLFTWTEDDRIWVGQRGKEGEFYLYTLRLVSPEG